VKWIEKCNTNATALNVLACHCEPGGRGNLVFREIASSSRSAGLLAMTIC
jgi:hypothetical protein